jgi:hypothetical protein
MAERIEKGCCGLTGHGKELTWRSTVILLGAAVGDVENGEGR